MQQLFTPLKNCVDTLRVIEITVSAVIIIIDLNVIEMNKNVYFLINK